MIDILQKNIVSIVSIIASLIALIIAFISALYTRSNLKFQQSVEIITAQRMKWIETMRQDLSDAIADVTILSYYENTLANAEDYYMNVGFSNRDDEEEYYHKVNNKTNKYRIEINERDIMKKIESTISMLNDGDNSLIEQLDELKDNILKGNYRLLANDGALISKLRKEIAIILRNKLEEVKLEVRKGVKPTLDD
jgi:thiamine pyrophosphate-dependent acetolactate synthase large subunit-like protein